MCFSTFSGKRRYTRSFFGGDSEIAQKLVSRDDELNIIHLHLICTAPRYSLEEGGSEFNILGSLTLESEEGILKVECMSDQRLELCKRAVEELLGGIVSYALDKYADVESVVSEADEAETSIGIENLDDIEEQMSLDFFERYHEKWLWEPSLQNSHLTYKTQESAFSDSMIQSLSQGSPHF